MKKSLLLILGFVLITITSCEYKFIDPIEIELPDEAVSFSQQIEPVFQDKCIACHSSRNPILTEGSAFNSLMDGSYINTTVPESSTLYEKVSSGHPGGSNSLSAQELALILKWIQDGAENN